MFVILRRLTVGLIALSALVAVAFYAQQGDPPTYTFRVTLGLLDKEPADWSGKVAVAGGEVVELSGWRFEENDSVEDKTAWKCATRRLIEPEARYPLTSPVKKPASPPEKPWPNGVTLTVRGQGPTITLTLPGGEIKFQTGDVPLGDPKLFLDKRVRVERLPATGLLREAAAKVGDGPQDDYPAFWIRYRTNKHYLAWVAYHKEKDRVLLVERDGPDGKWSEPVEVAGAGDHFRVALATTRDDTLWVVWASQRDHRWDLFGRPYKDGKLGDEVRLSETTGPNLWHRMTTDQKGRPWLVWKSCRAKDGGGTCADIYARCYDDGKWGDAVRVSTGDADNWDPTIAADYKEDRVWVAWDGYGSGAYNVYIRSLTGGPKPRSAACCLPGGRAGVPGPCERGLRPGRPRVAGVGPIRRQLGQGHRLPLSQERGHPALPGPQGAREVLGGRQVEGTASRPRRGAGGGPERIQRVAAVAGRRRGPDVARFSAPHLPQAAHRRLGNPGPLGRARHGLSRRPLDDAGGATAVRRPQRHARQFTAATGPCRQRLLCPPPPDNRDWRAPNMPPGNLAVAVSRLGGAAKAGEFKFRDSTASPKVANPVHLHRYEAEQVAAIRKHKIEFGGKTYHIYRGDLHRHTDMSIDGMGDGSVADLHRYALDAAALDFVLVSDHNLGNDQEYPWWRTAEGESDLYTIGGSFISLYGYERSVPYPNGHRNIVWPERGRARLPVPPRANARS